MHEDAVEERSDVGPRHALMQTYVDDPNQDKPANDKNGKNGTLHSDDTGGTGAGLPAVE